MDTYTITKIDTEKRHTFVTFSIGKEKFEKRLGDCPFEDKKSLDTYMAKYIEAYKLGKQLTDKKIHLDVDSIIGKVQKPTLEINK